MAETGDVTKEARLLEVLHGALATGVDEERERKLRCAITLVSQGPTWSFGIKTWYSVAWYMGIKLDIYPDMTRHTWSVELAMPHKSITHDGFKTNEGAKAAAIEAIIAAGVQV